jgi:hypothetical protein
VLVCRPPPVFIAVTAVGDAVDETAEGEVEGGGPNEFIITSKGEEAAELGAELGAPNGVDDIDDNDADAAGGGGIVKVLILNEDEEGGCGCACGGPDKGGRG